MPHQDESLALFHKRQLYQSNTKQCLSTVILTPTYDYTSLILPIHFIQLLARAQYIYSAVSMASLAL